MSDVQRRYDTTWTSLVNYPMAQWFREAKFGIYTHWGPYSVPAWGSNGTWYPNQMYNEKSPVFRHHSETYGHPSKFGYREFIPMFTAEKFDAIEWAEIFKKSGARFAGPVAEHHDGFSMWDSKLTKWNSVQMGPKRDVVGELAKAIRAQGMKYVTTFHHANNWWFFPTWNKEFDCSSPEYAGLYSRPHEQGEKPDDEYLGLWLGKLKEVIDSYEPDLIWFDFGLSKIKETCRKEFLAYYYNKAQEWGREVVVTFKDMHGHSNLPPMTGVMDLEVGKMNAMTHHPWITDTSIDVNPDGLSVWSHVREAGFKSAERLIHNLVDRVSKNGYLLLNVGPRADGTIPEPAQDILSEMGAWLEVNGEAIFGTTPWMISGEGPTESGGGDHFNEKNEPRLTVADIRFTSKGNDLYATVLGRPGDVVQIRSLKVKYESEIKAVQMLGHDGDLKWQLHPKEGMLIEVPHAVKTDYGVVFKICG